ncbi:MAG: DUF4835 family protein [Bacteroidia bacterium]|nr:DUF4835 family protein [Bacteroidia bacterium]
MRKIFLLVLISLFFRVVSAQELNCMISVVSQLVQGSNREIYDNMQKAMMEFVNNQNWTDHIFKDEERIQCQLMFNITDRISDNEFQGTLQIQSSRPIFGTSQTTVMLNHRDNDIHFKYDDFEPLRFNETQFTSNLVSLLAYYVNIILGLDYDSFALEGGSLFFQRAEAIKSNAQNAAESGWKAFEGIKNRYWLIENILNDKYRSVRSCIYRYHRMGLDRLVDRVDEARAEIAEALIEMRPAYRENPTAMIFQVFFTSKSDEIVNIFSESFPDEKNRVINALKEIDPANTAKWDRIAKSGL